MLLGTLPRKGTDMSFEPGQQILHYRLIEKIGEGGMGVVWKAEDTRLHRCVALKFVPEERSHDQDAVDRHLREARAASALNHPSICSIYDIGEWEGQQFIVMELLEGQPLSEMITGKPKSIDSAVELATQITEALIAAHKKGIIHRDIKPANIFIVDDGSSRPRAKILDFGLAKLAKAPGLEADDETRTALAMTTPGAVLGTVSYMSPEQALGKPLDHRTDIFSLGVVLYEMITGARAFAGDTSAAVFDAILNRAPTAPVELNSNVPDELGCILDKTLEKNPALRYQSAADLGADLKHCRRESSYGKEGVRPRTKTGSPRRRGIWLAAAAIVILFVGVVGTMVLREPTPHDPAPPTAASSGGSETPVDSVSSTGPSIAVLPFTNASGDPDQEYFSDGLTEDIITELSSYRELSVIAHSATARYKGTDVGARELGASLGVSYVLKGSVRKAEQQIRISVQLSDSSDGRLVWGTNYDRAQTARGLFELQDELTQQVVSEIAGFYGALTRAELPGLRRKPPASLDSYDCVLRTYEYLQVHTPEKHLAARNCLEGVVEADPNYADGKAWLAYLYADAHHHRWNERPAEDDALGRALALAEEAVRLDEANHVAHGALALTHFFRGEHERGKIEAYRTIDLSPNNAIWLAMLGFYLAVHEDFERALPMARRAVELTPHPPNWWRWAFFLDHYRHGRYEDALAEVVDANWESDFREPLYVAATYGQLGRHGDAEPALDELRALWKKPVGDIHQELIERHSFTPALAGQLMEGLVKAGLELESPLQEQG
jgi:serine/threonine protein kinase/Tfp pilus assembly protein PilF